MLAVQCKSTVSVYDAVLTALLATCVILFYKKKMVFRYVFVAAVAVEIVTALISRTALLPEYGLPILFDIGLIATLLMSRRVRNTF